MGDSQSDFIEELQQVKSAEPGRGLFEETEEKTKGTPRFPEEKVEEEEVERAEGETRAPRLSCNHEKWKLLRKEKKRKGESVVLFNRQ